MMIKILRPTRETTFISAGVFERLFTNHLGNIFDIRREPLTTWTNNILGTSEAPYSFQQAAQNFYRSTQEGDYFCPSYECMPLAPLFMALRNSSRANIRLLFIAHSPGVYNLEWVLLMPLLVPGDIIIAPSKSAKNIIEFLCPELSPFIKIIAHPIEVLPFFPSDKSDISRIVTLSRITETKLIHRQIEAMALLRTRGYEKLRMDIAGSLNVNDDPSKEVTQYVRSLQAKIQRLGLASTVRLVGPIIGDQQKAKFLAGAKMSVNLSISTEEACPKASVEPLGLGIPVVTTRWDGFVETVGKAGILVPVVEVSDGVLDVKAETVADAIEAVLKNPPTAEICQQQAKKFIPAVIGKKYQSVLQEGKKYQPAQEIQEDTFFEYDGRASASKGLLGKIAILQNFSWKELLEFQIAFFKKIQHRWKGKEIEDIYRGEILQNLLFISTKTPVEYFYAGKDPLKWTKTAGQDRNGEHDKLNFVETIARSIRTNSVISSKEACILSLSKGKQVKFLEESLKYLKENHEYFRARPYYQIELECLKRNYSKAYELFINHCSNGSIQEHDVHFLRQIAKICRNWKKPELALSWLREWLNKYPDSPKSGTIWLDLSVNAYYAGDKYVTEAKAAIKKAKYLLGNLLVIQKIQQNMLLEIISKAL